MLVNWRSYAAVSGSALAMATNAAAAVVYTPGPPVTSDPVRSVTSSNRTQSATNQVHLKSINGGPMFGVVCGCGDSGEIGFVPGVFQAMGAGYSFGVAWLAGEQ